MHEPPTEPIQSSDPAPVNQPEPKRVRVHNYSAKRGLDQPISYLLPVCEPIS